VKKIAIFVAVLMVIGAASGWSVSTTVDKFVENRTKSDIHPVQETAQILDLANKAVDETLKATDPILKHRKHITGPVMDVAKKIVNTVWDTVTLKSIRSK